jgi:hypothetical protein
MHGNMNIKKYHIFSWKRYHTNNGIYDRYPSPYPLACSHYISNTSQKHYGRYSNLQVSQQLKQYSDVVFTH